MSRPGKKVVKIVIAGGPGGGKDGLEVHLKPWIASLGFYPVFVPEAATLIMRAGLSPAHPREHPGDFQVAVLRHIMQTEDLLEKAALRLCGGKDIVMFCNRGAPEIQAYAGRELATEVLDEMDLTRGQLFARYQAVIFMVTSADGAPNAYMAALPGNPERYERTLEEAIVRDRATQECYLGADHLIVVPNPGDSKEAWLAKVEMAKRAIARVLGVPIPMEIERKWLISRADMKYVAYEEADLEQVYLVEQETGVERRIRKREFAGHTTYFLTLKERVGVGVRKEIECQISAGQYVLLKRNEADPDRKPVRKVRRYFLYDGQYFEMDHFLTPRGGLRLLELELPSMDVGVRLPHFLAIEREVTDDPSFTNSRLALIG